MRVVFSQIFVELTWLAPAYTAVLRSLNSANRPVLLREVVPAEISTQNI